jgi:hypothetical protein
VCTILAIGYGPTATSVKAAVQVVCQVCVLGKVGVRVFLALLQHKSLCYVTVAMADIKLDLGNTECFNGKNFHL